MEPVFVFFFVLVPSHPSDNRSAKRNGQRGTDHSDNGKRLTRHQKENQKHGVDNQADAESDRDTKWPFAFCVPEFPFGNAFFLNNTLA
jgi:hypothetical protein